MDEQQEVNEQPTNDTPPSSRDRPTIPGRMPPYVHEPAPVWPEHFPPFPENTPSISEELRADLCRVWALGFLDAMKGEAVNDDDMIESDIANSLVKLSEGCIDKAASVIAQIFQENPQTVFQTVYGVGFEVCSVMNLKAAAELNRN